MLPNKKNGITRKLIYWVTSHPWLKLISLILAIIVWLYVQEEISRFNY